MGILNPSGGMMNVIRCDMQQYLVWKWRPYNSKKDEADPNQRSNAIRMGSSLRVKDGEMAIFVYSKKDGTSNQEVIFGPYDDIIKTSNFPILSNLIGLAYGGGSPFQAECYFINLANNIQIKFGIPYFDVFDPRFPDLGVPVSARGSFTFKIDDYKAFIANNRLINFELDTLKTQLRSVSIRKVKSKIISFPSSKNIPLVQIEAHIDDINEQIKKELETEFFEIYGLKTRAFDIEAIEINKQSQNYIDLKNLTFDIVRDTTRRQVELNLRNLEDTQRINTTNMEETLRIQRQEMQRAQRLQSESANLAAHQIDRQAQVMTAMADGMAAGAMNNASIGGPVGNSGGFNPVNLMTGMAVGSALGGQMSNMINQVGSQWGQQQTPPPNPAQTQAATPPPLPSKQYYVYVNNTQNGPLTRQQISQLAQQGFISPSTPVWHEGLTEWIPAQNSDLADIFTQPTPPPPSCPPAPPVNPQII